MSSDSPSEERAATLTEAAEWHRHKRCSGPYHVEMSPNRQWNLIISGDPEQGALAWCADDEEAELVALAVNAALGAPPADQGEGGALTTDEASLLSDAVFSELGFYEIKHTVNAILAARTAQQSKS